MSNVSIVFLSLALIVIITILSAALYVFCSPMFVARLLRRGGDGELSYPDNYENRKEKVRIERNLPYPSKYGKNNFDLYFPKNKSNCPLILWVHGGAFVAGDKCGVENWGVMLASEGYAVAVMNYEWAPEAAYPAQVVQVSEALNEIIRISDKYSIDVSRVAVAGDSAGAHIASQFVLVHTNNKFQNILKITSPLQPDSLKCALLYCGPYDLKAMLEYNHKALRFFVNRIGWCYLGQRNWLKSQYINAVTPMNYVDENFVPCYITDGNKGSFESHGKALGNALKKQNVKVRERYFPAESGEVNHEYQMLLAEDNAILCFNDTIQFLEHNMRNK